MVEDQRAGALHLEGQGWRKLNSAFKWGYLLSAPPLLDGPGICEKKAEGHSASPRVALDQLACIQKHTAHIGDRTFNGTSKITPEQLDLFESLNLPKPA